MSKDGTCACQIKAAPEAEERVEAIAEAKPTRRKIGKPEEAPALRPYQLGTIECVPWFDLVTDHDKFDACLSEWRKLGQIENAETIVPAIGPFMEAQDQECFVIVLLDTQLYVRGCNLVAKGERDRVAAPLPDLLRIAIKGGAMAFIVLHNHPSGKSKPSKADRDLTRAIAKAAQCVDILFADHIVIGKGEHFSFRKNNLL